MALWAGEADRRKASKAPLVQTPLSLPRSTHREPQRRGQSGGSSALPPVAAPGHRQKANAGTPHPCRYLWQTLLAPCLSQAAGKQPPYHTVATTADASISARPPTILSHPAPHGPHTSPPRTNALAAPPRPSLLAGPGVPPTLPLRVPERRLKVREPPGLRPQRTWAETRKSPAFRSASRAAPET